MIISYNQHSFYSGVGMALLGRLNFTHAKLQTVVEGIRSLAAQDDPIDQVSLRDTTLVLFAQHNVFIGCLFVCSCCLRPSWLTG